MSAEALVLVAVILGMFLGLAARTYVVLLPMRVVLRLGPQGEVDVGVSLVFAVFLFLMLAISLNPHTTLSRVALRALPVCLAGLLLFGVGLFEAPKREGERRDRLFVGTALVATAFVIVFFSTE